MARQRVVQRQQGVASGDDDGKGRHGRQHEKEGGIDKGWNGQHDSGTEGCTRRRVKLMKGGSMMALGNTARGGMAGRRQQEAARRRVAQRG